MWPTSPAASVYAGPAVTARGDAARLSRQTCSRELSHQQPTVDQNIHRNELCRASFLLRQESEEKGLMLLLRNLKKKEERFKTKNLLVFSLNLSSFEH